MARDEVGDGAEEHPAEGAAAVRAQDEQRGLVALRPVEELAADAPAVLNLHDGEVEEALGREGRGAGTAGILR